MHFLAFLIDSCYAEALSNQIAPFSAVDQSKAGKVSWCVLCLLTIVVLLQIKKSGFVFNVQPETIWAEMKKRFEGCKNNFMDIS